MLEKELEAKLQKFCKSHGILCYKFSSPAHRGVPDRILISPRGKVMLLELKRLGQRPTNLQRHELRRLRANNAVADWADNMQSVESLVLLHFGTL